MEEKHDVSAYGVIPYVLLIGKSPFATSKDIQAGLVEGSSAWERLEARCARGHKLEGEEEDGGGWEIDRSTAAAGADADA
jgi:hypothetical protein